MVIIISSKVIPFEFPGEKSCLIQRVACPSPKEEKDDNLMIRLSFGGDREDVFLKEKQWPTLIITISIIH